MAAWHSERRAALPASIRLELLGCLLSSLPQAVSISATTMIGAIALALRSGAMVDLCLAIAIAAIGVVRVIVLLMYRRRSNVAATLASIRPWYRWHAGGLVAQAAALGLQSLHAFTNGDTPAALLALGFVLAFCAGACARLSVVPWVPIATSLLMLVPTIYGALMSPELPIKLAGVFLIAFIPVIAEATLYLHRLVVDRLLAVQEASHRASHDGLTNLANRAMFHQQLALACERTTTTGEDFAVLYLDLDGFKGINDKMGHAAGDQVLIEIAERLRLSIGSDDLACRIGGDEFAILVRTDPDGAAVTGLADHLATTIAGPIRLQNGPITVGVSIGVAYSSTHAGTPSDILNAADQAMYAAKDDSGARWRVASAGRRYAHVA